MVQKIMDLHAQKEYKIETLFVACAIMDRYIYILRPRSFTPEMMINLATICVLMSAKME